MKKNKKNKIRKKTTLLGGAAKSLRKLSKGASQGLGGLSTTQKVAGGAALVALGLSYLAKRRRGSAAPAASPDALATPAADPLAEPTLAAAGNEPTDDPGAAAGDSAEAAA